LSPESRCQAQKLIWTAVRIKQCQTDWTAPLLSIYSPGHFDSEQLHAIATPNRIPENSALVAVFAEDLPIG